MEENKDSQQISDLLHTLKNQIHTELSFCNEDVTPNVCAMIHAPGGKEKIVNLICEYVGNHGLTISDAIVTIERERSANLSELD